MASKQSFDVDDDFLMELEDATKNIVQVVKKWKDRDKSLNALATDGVLQEGLTEDDPNFEAKRYSRRSTLKKLLGEQERSAAEQASMVPPGMEGQMAASIPGAMPGGDQPSAPPMMPPPGLPGAPMG